MPILLIAEADLGASAANGSKVRKGDLNSKKCYATHECRLWGSCDAAMDNPFKVHFEPILLKNSDLRLILELIVHTAHIKKFGEVYGQKMGLLALFRLVSPFRSNPHKISSSMCFCQKFSKTQIESFSKESAES